MQRTPATIALAALTAALTVTVLAIAGAESTASSVEPAIKTTESRAQVPTTTPTPTAPPTTLRPTPSETTVSKAPVVSSHATAPANAYVAIPAPVHISQTTYTAEGDTITAGLAPMNSWTTYITDPHITFAPGSAGVGWRSDEIVDAAIAHGIPNVTAMVVMGCTNDIAQGIDWHNCLTQWDRLAAAAPAGVHVLASAIAPSNVPAWAAATLDYNAALRTHATQKGWAFVDPYAAIRADDGGFLPGFQRDPANDPTDPNNVGQQIAAGVLGPVLLPLGQPAHR